MLACLLTCLWFEAMSTEQATSEEEMSGSLIMLCLLLLLLFYPSVYLSIRLSRSYGVCLIHRILPAITALTHHGEYFMLQLVLRACCSKVKLS